MRTLILSWANIVLALAFCGPVAAADDAGAKFIEYFAYSKAIELKNDDVRVVLCPQVGGRVLEYAWRGQNALYLADEEKDWRPGASIPVTAGRFDIGPEQVVPPRPTLWAGAWSAEIIGPRSARLVSQKDESAGVQLTRDFQLDAASSRLLCTQTIINVSDEVKDYCHWSRTFATGNGIAIVPLTPRSRFPNKYVMYEDGGLINMRPEDAHIRERDGVLEIFGVPRKPKLGFDSCAGWLAYVTRDNLLFVKRFPTYADRVYNEVAGLTISVWYPEDLRVELEPIGPRERLQPGESASFTEEWHLAPFPFPKDGRPLDLSLLRQHISNLPTPPDQQ